MRVSEFNKVGNKLPEAISESELHKIISTTSKPHHRLAFSLGFYEAMRISEVVKLQPEDIDIQSKILKIRQSKGSKDRNIPIAPQVFKSLKKFEAIKCGARALQIAFKNKARQALDKDLHFHTLRHSGLTYYGVVKRWNILDLQRFAGHSNTNTTSIYYHIRPEQMVKRMWELE